MVHLAQRLSKVGFCPATACGSPWTALEPASSSPPLHCTWQAVTGHRSPSQTLLPWGTSHIPWNTYKVTIGSQATAPRVCPAYQPACSGRSGRSGASRQLKQEPTVHIAWLRDSWLGWTSQPGRSGPHTFTGTLTALTAGMQAHTLVPLHDTATTAGACSPHRGCSAQMTKDVCTTGPHEISSL